MMTRAIVSQFIKWGRDPIRLWSFTVLQEKVGHLGSKYFSYEEYDVEWCRMRGCYLFHECGGGGGRSAVSVSGIYHVSGDVQVKETAPTWCSARDRPPWRGKRTLAIRRRNQTRRLRQLPMCFSEMKPGWDILNWLEWNAIQEGTQYCSECDDWLPTDADVPCDHVWWCENEAWWSTPTEPCKCRNKCSAEEEIDA